MTISPKPQKPGTCDSLRTATCDLPHAGHNSFAALLCSSDDESQDTADCSADDAMVECSGSKGDDSSCCSFVHRSWSAGLPDSCCLEHMCGCQNYGPFLGTLNNRCRILIGTQKGNVILTTTHMYSCEPDLSSRWIGTREGFWGGIWSVQVCFRGIR